MDHSPDMTFRSAIIGTVQTRQPGQRSRLLGNLEIIGRAETSQAAQNKPAPGPREP
jgi:hypothetical protein